MGVISVELEEILGTDNVVEIFLVWSKQKTKMFVKLYFFFIVGT
jgi:hypothetical protein